MAVRSICTGLAVFLVNVPCVVGVRREGVGLHEKSNSASGLADVAWDKMRAYEGQKLTPGVKKTFTDLRKELAGPVTDAILADHLLTQRSVDKLVAVLGNSTKAAVQAKMSATAAHDVWVNSVQVVKNTLQNHEKTVLQNSQNKKDKLRLCAKARSLEPFTAKVTQFKQFFCNISISGNCDAELKAFKDKLVAEQERVNKLNDIAKTKHAAAKGLCDEAVALVEKTTEDANALYSLYGSKLKESGELKGARDLSICSFGEKLKQKCADQGGYKTRVQQIKQVNGSEWSHPDREQEWKTTNMTICMIDAFLQSNSLDSAEIQKCSTTPVSVGTIDYRASEASALMTGDKFTCSETELIFANDWVEPKIGGSSVKSNMYIKKPARNLAVSWHSSSSNPMAVCNPP